MKRIAPPRRLEIPALRRLIATLVALLGIGGSFGSSAVLAQSSSNVCSQIGTDDTLRPLPAELVPAARRVFDLDGSLSANYVRAATSLRCDQGRALLCYVGANLNCGKADTSRSMSAADEYCRDNPAAVGIPMSVTGHATVYDWSCDGGNAKAGEQIVATDRRGFIADNWKRLD